jgi:sugar/nucleoside kinase (ribokinase family)
MFMRKRIIGVGNAIVDVLAYTDGAFVSEASLNLGSMTLIDAKQAKKIYDKIGAATEVSGGSVANTMVGIASLGGTAEFVGNVGEDKVGKIFIDSLIRSDVASHISSSEGSTAKCIILITGEGNNTERTMATSLGVSTDLDITKINLESLKNARFLYIEGYLWDNPKSRSACMYLANAAKFYGVDIAFSLSDKFCVQRHRDEFYSFIFNNVDVLFGNTSEFAELGVAIDDVAKLASISAITKGAEGSTIIQGNNKIEVSGVSVEVFDTTGAGDSYAAGFLYGLAENYPLDKCGKLASMCAADVIKFIGGRPATKLKDLIEKL